MLNMKEIYNYVYKEFKIDLNAYKEIQMNRRIESFISKTESITANDFINKCSCDLNLKDKFLDQITINVTEFFRNKDIFFQLKQIFEEGIPKKSSYRIWCCACSNGSEPYSVGMLLNSMGFDVEILATDIDNKILKYAQEGKYLKEEVESVPKEYINKYFEKNQDGNYKISNVIRKLVSFKKHDLILDSYPGDFDLILCRNVFIYFKKEEQIKIYNKFYKSLNDNGVVFIGATENIYDYNNIGFNKLGAFFYQKVVE